MTFIGGVLLVIDAFSPVRGLYLAGGKIKWEWLKAKLHPEPHQSDPGPPPNDPEELKHASRSQWLTRAGFVLVTLGFLLDMAGKLHWF